jgi:hypothetical protein
MAVRLEMEGLAAGAGHGARLWHAGGGARERAARRLEGQRRIRLRARPRGGGGVDGSVATGAAVGEVEEDPDVWDPHVGEMREVQCARAILSIRT